MTDEKDPPELDELEPLEELEAPPALTELPAAATELPARAAAREPGQKRELEEAPLMLRKASMILLAGTLLPWLVSARTAGIPWGPLMSAKAVAAIAAWIIHQGYLATHGGKAVGFIRKLARVGGPAPEKKSRRDKDSGAQAFVGWLKRNLVPIFGWLVFFGAIFLLKNAWPMNPADADHPKGPWMAPGFAPAVGELLTLALATNTFSHIFGYEHGGKFNPLFPLMFLGPGLAGLFGALTAFGNNPIGGVGCLVVAAGGILASYVMVVSMKQAKIEGDRKRDAAREERKAARQSQRT